MPGEQAVGVFLSRSSVRVALLESTAAGLQALALREAPLSVRAVDDSGLVRDPAQVAEAVRGALADTPVQTTDFRLALGGESLVLRNMSLPPMPAPEMREAIRAEIEHYSLFSLGEEVIGYQQAAAEEQAEAVSLMVTATHRQLAESADAALAAMGGAGSGCELAILAGARAAGHAGQLASAPEGYTMLLLLGSWGSEAVIIGGGQVLFSHVLDLRIRNVLRAAEGGEGLGFLEQAPQEGEGDEATDPAQVVATAAGRCVRFFQREMPGSAKVSLALTVSDVPLPDDFHAQLGERLGMAAREANPLASLEVVDPRWPREREDKAVSSYAPAIGAALAALDAWGNVFWAPLSPIPAEVGRAPARPLVPILLPAGVLLVGLLATGAVFKLQGSLAQRRAAGIETQIRTAAQQTEATESMSPEEKRAMLAGIEQARATIEPKAAKQWYPVLDEIVARLPQGASLQALEIDESGNTLIKGTTPDQSGAAKLADELRGAPGISQVRLSSLEAVGESGAAVSFELVAKVR